MTQKQSQYLFYGLLTFLVFSLFHRLGFLDLKFEEPRRALVSLEMIRSGDWLHPSIYGLPYYNKPPIYNWVLALFIKVFGTSDWVIRLPTVVSLLTIGGLHIAFFRNKIGWDQAVWSAIFFVTSLNIYLYFSFQGEIDMFYTLIIYVQVLLIFHFFHLRQFWGLFLFSYLLTAIGFLTKGLPSIGFQGLTLIGLMLYYRRFKWFFSLQHLVAGFLSVLLMAVYFIIYDATGGQSEYYLAKIFFEGARRTVNHRDNFPFLKALLSFVPLMIYLLSPWVLIGIFGVSKDQIKRQLKNPWLVYSLVFLAFNLPLYWFSAGTRDRYLYMFLPFFFVWIAQWFHGGIEVKKVRIGSAVLFGLLGLSALVALFTEFGEYPSSTYGLIFMGLFLGLLAWVTYRYTSFPLSHSWLALLICLRFGFNTLVFDIRKSEEKSKDYESIVQEIKSIVNDQPVYYHSPLAHEEIVLPILGSSLYFPKVKRLDYTFTYYLNRQTEAPVLYLEYLTPSKYVIIISEELKTQTNGILFQFELNGSNYSLIKT